MLTVLLYALVVAARECPPAKECHPTLTVPRGEVPRDVGPLPVVPTKPLPNPKG